MSHRFERVREHVGNNHCVKGQYGFDAPYVPLALGIVSAAAFALGAALALNGSAAWGAVAALYGIFFALSTASFVYTTLRGKFHCWSDVFSDMALRGDEQLLDLGCGRGAVALTGARHLTRGHVTGVDIWSQSDQSGNAIAVTRRNAEREGVGDRASFETADMRALPFSEGAFDIVVSSLAVHNIPDAEGRGRAIDEAFRVLRVGGKLYLADFRSLDEYTARLQAVGARNIQRRQLGWRFWYGGPWGATAMITATK